MPDAQSRPNQKLPCLRSSVAEYVPDSPTSVAFSGPRSPQWDPHCDEDFTVPYWGWRWIAREETAARYRILLRENTEGDSQGEVFHQMVYRSFLDEEIAGRYWIESMAVEAFAYLDARRRQLHP